MPADTTDERRTDMGKLVDALEAMPDSPLTEWYNAIRQPTDGVEEVFVSIEFGADDIERVSVHEVSDGSEIYSPWADLTLKHEPTAFISKADFRERVREKASEKLGWD
jgi:hypothetical protein